jgi:hypothetical protein
MCQFFGIKVSNYESPNFINYIRTEETNPDALGNTFLTLDIKEETKLREEFIKQALALKAPFTDTHKAAAANVPIATGVSKLIQGTIGRAGSAKSSFMRSKFSGDIKNTMFVVPSNKLKKEYVDMGYLARTLASFLALGKHFKNIIIDEVFVLHPYTPFLMTKFCDNLYIIGDNLQTSYGSSDVQSKFSLTKLIDITNFPIRHISYTVPLDAAFLCQTQLNYGLFVIQKSSNQSSTCKRSTKHWTQSASQRIIGRCTRVSNLGQPRRCKVLAIRKSI